MQESGFIKIFPEIYLTLSGACFSLFSQITKCLILSFLLNPFQGTLSVSDCSGQ